jgi:hypothetical protein
MALRAPHLFVLLPMFSARLSNLSSQTLCSPRRNKHSSLSIRIAATPPSNTLPDQAHLLFFC